MRLEEIVRASADVAATRSRRAKIERLASTLLQLRPDEVPIAVGYLAGEIPQGSIGVGWAALRSIPAPAGDATLELLDVHAALAQIARAVGPGSQAARRSLLTGLFGRATEPEQRFLTRLLLGDLRQGALEGVMVEAVARAAGLPAADVRRALMLAGDLGEVARAALSEGAPGLSRFRLTVLRPV